MDLEKNNKDNNNVQNTEVDNAGFKFMNCKKMEFTKLYVKF